MSGDFVNDWCCTLLVGDDGVECGPTVGHSVRGVRDTRQVKLESFVLCERESQLLKIENNAIM